MPNGTLRERRGFLRRLPDEAFSPLSMRQHEGREYVTALSGKRRGFKPSFFGNIMASITQAFKNNFVFNSQTALEALPSSVLIDKNVYYYISSGVVQMALYDASSTASLSDNVFKPNDVVLPAAGRFLRQPKGYIESASQLRNELKQILVFGTKAALLATASSTFVDGQVYYYLSNNGEQVNQVVWKASSTATPDGNTILVPNDVVLPAPGRFFVQTGTAITGAQFVNLFNTEIVFDSQATLLAQDSRRWINNTVYFYLSGNRIRMVVWKASATDATTPTILRPNDLSPSQPGRFFVEDFATSSPAIKADGVALYDSLADILAIPISQLVNGTIYHYLDSDNRRQSVVWREGLTAPVSDPLYYEPNGLPAGRFFLYDHYTPYEQEFTDNPPLLRNSTELIDGQLYYSTNGTVAFLLLWDASSTATVDNVNVFAALDNPPTGRYLRQNTGTGGLFVPYPNLSAILNVPASRLVNNRIYYTQEGSGDSIVVLRWDATSTAPDDNNTIFRAVNSSVGRFYKLPSPSFPLAHNTIADVLAIPTANLVDGAYYYCYGRPNLLSVLYWVENSSANGDGVSILKPNDMFDGRFVKLVQRATVADTVRFFTGSSPNVGVLYRLVEADNSQSFFAKQHVGFNIGYVPPTVSLWTAESASPLFPPPSGYEIFSDSYFVRRLAIDPLFASVYMPFNFSHRVPYLAPYQYFNWSPLPQLLKVVFDDFTTYAKYPYIVEGDGNDGSYSSFGVNKCLELNNSSANTVLTSSLRITRAEEIPFTDLGPNRITINSSFDPFGSLNMQDGRIVCEATVRVVADQYMDWVFGFHKTFDTSLTYNDPNNFVCVYRRRAVSVNRLYIGTGDGASTFNTQDTGIDLDYNEPPDSAIQPTLDFIVTLIADFNNHTNLLTVQLVVQNYGSYTFETPYSASDRISFFMQMQNQSFTDTNNATSYGKGRMQCLYHLMMQESTLSRAIVPFGTLYSSF